MIITIDSNIINYRQEDMIINQIEAFADQKNLKIVGSQRLLDEMESYSDSASEKAESIGNISEPFTIGYSKIGSGYISGENDCPSFKEIASILFPNSSSDQLTDNELNDVMHLIAHSHSESDYFITRNTKDFINEKKTNKNRHKDLKNLKRDKLKELGIHIRTPEEILKELKAICL